MSDLATTENRSVSKRDQDEGRNGNEENEITIVLGDKYQSGQSFPMAVVYFPEHKRIVTSGYDEKVKVWDISPEFKVKECHTFDFSEGDMNVLSKWKRNSVLCSGSLPTIYECSVVRPFNKLKEVRFPFPNFRNSINFMIPLSHHTIHSENNENELLAVDENCDLYHINFSTEKFEKRVDGEAMGYKTLGYSQLILSTTFPNSVFVNGEFTNNRSLKNRVFRQSKGKTETNVLLLNYEEGSVVMSFVMYFDTYAIATFHDKDKKELRFAYLHFFELTEIFDFRYLVCGGLQSGILVFDVLSGTLLREVVAKKSVTCFLRVGSSHFMVGEYDTMIEFVDFDDIVRFGEVLGQFDNRVPIYSKSFLGGDEFTRSFNEDVQVMRILKMPEKKRRESDDDEIVIIGLLQNGDMRVLRIQNLKFKSVRDEEMKLMEQDERERMLYLSELDDLERITIRIEGQGTVLHVLRVFMK